MRATLPPSLLLRLSEFIAAQTGLAFPEARWSDLERGIAAAAPELGFGDAESCAYGLLGVAPTRRIDEILATHLSVGETYFFREQPSLDALRDHVLPQLLHARRETRRLRIWSAGCSTGEEAYTIAMLLDALVPARESWNISILATDFNPAFLRKATQGVYGEWSFRDVGSPLRTRYFRRTQDGRYEVLPRIRERVTFSYLNFATDACPALISDPGAMDLILCRNVLMYFTAERMRKTIGNFHRVLAGDGWLVVSPAETSNELFSSFVPVDFPGAVLYRKTPDAESRRTTIPYSVAEMEEINDPQQPEGEIALARQRLQPAPVSREVRVSVPMPSLRMARHCADRGRLEEGLAWCERAIAADKAEPAPHYLCATILQAQGRNEEAARSLMRVLYLDPGFVLAHFALGNLHQMQGCDRKARRHFENALALVRRCEAEAILPEADGLTAGRMAEILSGLLAVSRVASA